MVERKMKGTKEDLIEELKGVRSEAKVWKFLKSVRTDRNMISEGVGIEE